MQKNDSTRLRVAVTGATGFLGRYLVKELLKRGHSAVAVARNPQRVPQLVAAGVELRKADLKDRHSLTEAFRQCDAVISCAALFDLKNRNWEDHFRANIEGTENVFAALSEAGVKRVIHISSVAVYRRAFGLKIQQLDESSPQHAVDRPPPRWMSYPVSKAASEKKAWELAEKHHLQLTCIRPCGIYGAYDPNSTRLFHWLWNRKIGVVPAGSLQVPLVYAGDVAHATVAALENARSVGKSYNTTQGRVSLTEFYAAWKEAGFPTPSFPIPFPIYGGIEYQCSEAARDLGFQNRSYLDGLKETRQIESSQGL